MNGGYVMIDMMGIDLAAPPSDPVDGIYEKFDSAFSSGKPIILIGGTIGGAEVSPVPTTAIKYTTAIVVGVLASRVRVNNDDTIVLVS